MYILLLVSCFGHIATSSSFSFSFFLSRIQKGWERQVSIGFLFIYQVTMFGYLLSIHFSNIFFFFSYNTSPVIAICIEYVIGCTRTMHFCFSSTAINEQPHLTSTYTFSLTRTWFSLSLLLLFSHKQNDISIISHYIQHSQSQRTHECEDWRTYALSWHAWPCIASFCFLHLVKYHIVCSKALQVIRIIL